MKVDKRFPRQVAVLFAGALLVAAFPLAQAGPGILAAVVVGAVLSTVNILAGFFAIEYSLDKSHDTFMKFVLGGMGIRMAVLLGILVLLIKFSGLHAVALVVSVLSFYIMYLVLELLYIQKKVSHKQQS